MGCFVVLFMLLMIPLLFLIPTFGIFFFIAIGVFVTILIRDKENRLSHTISFLVGSTIFFLLFIIFTITSLVFGGDSNLFLGDTRYVKINDQYSLSQVDDGQFYIDGSMELYGVDSLAEKQGYVYGHQKNNYFMISLKDGIVKKDTIFEYLELPDNCLKRDMVTSEEFLWTKSQEKSRDWQEILLWPAIIAFGIAFLISFFTKKLVKWLEIKYKKWCEKKDNENNQNNENDNHNDKGLAPIDLNGEP